jgi:hypothetical protein
MAFALRISSSSEPALVLFSFKQLASGAQAPWQPMVASEFCVVQHNADDRATPTATTPTAAAAGRGLRLAPLRAGAPASALPVGAMGVARARSTHVPSARKAPAAADANEPYDLDDDADDDGALADSDADEPPAPASGHGPPLVMAEACASSPSPTEASEPIYQAIISWEQQTHQKLVQQQQQQQQQQYAFGGYQQQPQLQQYAYAQQPNFGYGYAPQFAQFQPNLFQQLQQQQLAMNAQYASASYYHQLHSKQQQQPPFGVPFQQLAQQPAFQPQGNVTR